MPHAFPVADDMPHPALDELIAFGQGQLLEPSVLTAIERHLESCLECASVAAEVPDDPFLTTVRANPCVPAVVAANRPARLMAGFEILDEIGRGGAGIVYRARQPGLDRIVALKRLHEGSTPAALARLRREALVLGRLRHPNIVQVHDVGEQDGHPYLALEYVAGGDLRQRLAQRPLTPRQSAELVMTLAETTAFAHSHGIVHRDLKPSNVLLANPKSPELPAPNSPDAESIPLPRIADFGLAKLLDADVDQTRTGALLGTPGYMAPEQTTGSPAASEPAVDIYALGAILYEMLTGVPPFRGASVTETLEQVRSRDPVPPRVIQPRIPRDLETICLKCLEKEPQSRYATAADLAADLQRHLTGQPILARPARTHERLWKWMRRRPATAALLVVCSLTLIAGAAGLAIHQTRLRRETRRADASYLEAREAIRRMIARLSDPRWSRSPQMAELRRELQQEARPFFETILSQLPPEDASTRLDRFQVARELGALEADLGMLDDAERHLEHAIDLIETLIDKHPDSDEYQTELADCLNKLGVLCARRNQPDDALRHYERALGLLEQSDRHRPDGQSLLASRAQTRLNIGAVYNNLLRLQEAEREYRLALTLRKELWQADPESAANRQALAEVLANLALVVGPHSPAEALGGFQEAESLLKSVVAAGEAWSQSAAVSLAACYINWANLEHSTGKTEVALGHLQESITLLEGILSREPNWFSARGFLSTAHAARAQVLVSQGNDEQALADWDGAVRFALADTDRQLVRWFRLLTLGRLKRHEAATTEVAELTEPLSGSSADLYNLACVTSLACAAVPTDDRLDAARAAELLDRYTAQAIALLRRASAAGFFADPENQKLLHTDPDLAALRDRPESTLR